MRAKTEPALRTHSVRTEPARTWNRSGSIWFCSNSTTGYTPAIWSLIQTKYPFPHLAICLSVCLQHILFFPSHPPCAYITSRAHYRQWRTKNFEDRGLATGLYRSRDLSSRMCRAPFTPSTTDLEALTFSYLSFCKYLILIPDHRRGNPLLLRVLCRYSFHSRQRKANINDSQVCQKNEVKWKLLFVVWRIHLKFFCHEI